jgi:general stress protein 26
MDEKEIKRAGLELMEKAAVVILSGVGPDGHPHSRAVFNLRNKTQYARLAHLFEGHDEDFMVLIGTNTSSVKAAELRANPKASLYYCIPEQFHGMMLVGDMEVLQDDDLRRALWMQGWEQYYPAGPLDPDYTVLRMYPKYAHGWYRSTKFELDF